MKHAFNCFCVTFLLSMFRRACAQVLGGSGGKQFNFVPSKIFVPPTLIPKITAGRGKFKCLHMSCVTPVVPSKLDPLRCVCYPKRLAFKLCDPQFLLIGKKCAFGFFVNLCDVSCSLVTHVPWRYAYPRTHRESYILSLNI